MSQGSTPSHQPPSPGSHYQPALGVVLVIVALFVVATYLMLRSTSPSTSGTTGSTTTTTVASGSAKPHPPKAKVRVQVANGTGTTGLARTYTQQLQALGWDTLPQENASAKVSSTIIYFNTGYVWAAREIATEIKVKSSAIQPLNGLSPAPGTASDDVVVVLGPNLAIKG